MPDKLIACSKQLQDEQSKLKCEVKAVDPEDDLFTWEKTDMVDALKTEVEKRK